MHTSAVCHADANFIMPPPSKQHTLNCNKFNICSSKPPARLYSMNMKRRHSHNVHRVVEFEPFGPAALSSSRFMTCCAVQGLPAGPCWLAGQAAAPGRMPAVLSGHECPQSSARLHLEDTGRICRPNTISAPFNFQAPSSQLVTKTDICSAEWYCAEAQ